MSSYASWLAIFCSWSSYMGQARLRKPGEGLPCIFFPFFFKKQMKMI